MPVRETNDTGRLDQRARCFSSSNAKSTLCRCFSSSVERKLFASRTILEVAVCAAAAVAANQIAANAQTPLIVLIEKTFIRILPFTHLRTAVTGTSPDFGTL